MKRSLILFFLILLAVLLLAACGDPPEVTTPAATTTATEMAAEPGTTTTTASITTVPTTLMTISKNYIKEVVTMNTGDIRLTFRDDTRLNIGSLPLREGYNSAEIRTKLDKYTGIATLTITESASMNVANVQLGKAKEPTVVELREFDSTLQYRFVGDTEWEPLCRIDGEGMEAGSTPLLLLAETLGISRVSEATGDGVTLVIADGNIAFRARNWVREGYDFLTSCELHSSATNGNFMFRRFDEIPATDAPSSLSVSPSTLFKQASDEIPSISMNSTYIAARHGYYLISAVPNTAGLCEEDIGAIFTRKGDGQQYVLVKLPGTMLWLCPFDEDAMKTGDFGRYAFGSNGLLRAGDVLTTVDTLSRPVSTLTVSADAVLSQFYVATNHAKQLALLNGTQEVDLTQDGVYTADFVDFYEEYDVIYLPEMLMYLMDNLGYNTNDSHHDEELTRAYLTFSLTHRFLKNGSYTVYQTVTIRNDVKNVHYYGVMSMPFPGDSHYVYAPGSTNVGTPTLQTNTTVEANGGPFIRSYYQLTDAIGTKGINCGYYPYFGVATDERREEALGNKAGVSVGQWYQTRKMYPYLFMNRDMKAGDTIDFIGYHVPTVKLADDFFAVNWYFVGDEIYLSFHTDRAAERQFVPLPNSPYLMGLTVTVDEATEGFTVHSATVSEAGIEVSTSGAGYATVKLMPAE